MAAIGSVPPRHPGFKAAVFALLACNAAIYLFTGALRQALDSVAWLTLLALFALETGFADRFRANNMARAIHGVRLVAAAAVCAAAVGYVKQREWLDTVNSGLWIAVVALLEFEVRFPGTVARRRAWFAATAMALYGGLAVLVVVWAWYGEWFNAYDALLWLVAFAMIEMDVLQTSCEEIAI